MFFVGMWTWYHLQFWKSLFYSGWVPFGRGSSGDFQEKCSQSHWAGRSFTGGKQIKLLWSKYGHARLWLEKVPVSLSL